MTDQLQESNNPEQDMQAIPNGRAEPLARSDQNNQMFMVQQETIQTPHLPPKFLREYDQIVPGSAQRLFEMVEKQQEFAFEVKRHEMATITENAKRLEKVDLANIKEQNDAAEARMREIRLKERGQNFAFAIFLIAIGAACYFGYIGLEKAAIVTIGVIASAMGLVLYTYRNSKSEENTN